ncbi:hypothetical protein DFH07DRAFT_950847 [Mycena maculata]|uniref:EH domain-containing protein n=1 Tax=Mycena maculata TaxID=230809 RepID=A0AAD7NX54_9AGAR|nr:hypothetical protein DFH07DRAFT_950847 [Mycena maculata]
MSQQHTQIPWALRRALAEKNSHDAIFCAWARVQNTGFVSEDELARIWTLADVDGEASLTWPSFASPWTLCARLNGGEIPEKLFP